MRWSPFQPKVRLDPYPMYRDQRSIASTFRHYPFVYVLGYDQAKQVLKNGQVYSVARGLSDSNLPLDAFRRVIKYLLFNLDGSSHKVMRDFGAFGMRGIDLTKIVREENDKLVRQLATRDTFDFIEEWSLPLSIKVTRRLLGLPPDFDEKVSQWAEDLGRTGGLFFTEEDYRVIEVACQEIESCVHDLCKVGFCEDDLSFLGNLHRAYRANGRSEENIEEMVSWAAVILLASLETTNGSLGNSVFHLLQQKDQFNLIKSDPSLLRLAIEELLRYDSPLQFASRIVTTPTSLDGLDLEKGTFVVVGLGAANRDRNVFDHPDNLRLDRRPNPHIAFGFGEHYCFGARVARLEMEYMLSSLTRDFPELELSGKPPTMRTVNTIKSFASLEVTHR